jgi:lipopolysaccharide/colanic/teichoic acid biosynthesis glycosyltransferase
MSNFNFDTLENRPLDANTCVNVVDKSDTSVSLISIDDCAEFKSTNLINDEANINRLFGSINEIINYDDVFIGCFETFTARRKRKRVYSIPVVWRFFLIYELIFLRAFPKIPFLKPIYLFFTRGKNRLLSKAEVLGRLVRAGFVIEDCFSENGISWFKARKKAQPKADKNRNDGLLIQLKRIGKSGKEFHVFKFRTMHPYSEYLHDYILRNNGYAQSGKPADDFRITPWGKFLRKYWLDELPQLVNVLRGEMKIVGTRPVSARYFQDIPEDLQKLRNTQKPGCIPPYVALNMKSDVESVQQSERIYLTEKLQRPYSTDTRYFFRALYNIIVRRKRSA